MLDHQFRDGFWLHASERLFVLWEFMNKTNRKNILHAELDLFFKEQNLNNLDLMKIDAEGFEKYIILGGLTTLTRFHPIILMEALTDDELITQKNLLKTIGYTSLFRIKGTESDCRNYLWINANSANYEYLKKVLPTDKLIRLDF